MTYQELLELKNKRALKVKEGDDLLKKKDFAAHKNLMGEVAKMNVEIDAAEAQLAEEGRFDDKDEKLKGIHMSYQKQQEEKAKGKVVDDIRRSNEYANAFAKALRSGVTVKRARGMEGYEPLMKALQETGGDPEGADGGFLVPQDFDNMIHEYEKEYLDLSQLFTVESVRSSSGWRAVEQGKRKALPKISEMGTIGKDDQPKFVKVPYAVEKYGDRSRPSCWRTTPPDSSSTWRAGSVPSTSSPRTPCCWACSRLWRPRCPSPPAARPRICARL